MRIRPSPPLRDFEVSAILREVAEAGSGKSQFRRPLKPQPFIDRSGNLCVPDRHGGIENWGQNIDGTPCTRNFIKWRVPFAIGDLLWCRETWKPHSLYAELPPRLIPQTKVFFAADDGYSPSNTPWRSSTQMPRWASRLTLEVVDVKIGRLQEISDGDARAEGAVEATAGWFTAAPGQASPIAVGAFALSWQSIHGPGSWSANPFVAAVTFRPHLANVETFVNCRYGGA